MIRVTKAEEPSHITVTVEGQLIGESIAVVEDCCNEARSDGQPVELFLRNVTTVDQAGRMLLSRLAGKGIRLAASGVYTSYLIESLDPNGTVPGKSAASAAQVQAQMRKSASTDFRKG